MKYIASVSFGKDSLAMVLRLLEENKPLDEVVFYDTGMEFQAIYNNAHRVEKLLKDRGIKFTTLKPKEPFKFKMLDKVVNKGKANEHKGYAWCGGKCRWGTTEKLRAIEKYCLGNVEYVGLAFDEKERVLKKRRGNKAFPLVEWQMSEKDCLEYCYKRGYTWNEDGVELYKILDRVSCWCCANKNIKELRNYYKYLPEYWKGLKDLQDHIDRPFKSNKTIYDLEKQFQGEKNNE